MIKEVRKLMLSVFALMLFLAFSVAVHIGVAYWWRDLQSQQSMSGKAVADQPDDGKNELVAYGEELIAHTSRYLGPNGTVAPLTNGLNCQNCHLEAGTKVFGNNYSMVATSYPRFRTRSGTVEGFVERVNGCIERSLNGKPLEADSREMRAIVAYMKWVGKDVVKGTEPQGAGLPAIEFLDRPANPEKGKIAYQTFCNRCHGEDGQGVRLAGSNEWQYPPLWGDNSYNTGAGLYRISKFAAFVKGNMPFGISFQNPLLTDEEAWDIAAYVNSMPRPHKEFQNDWPDLNDKPVDHPFGPYTDSFSETQHKYGPFPPILNSKKALP